MSMRDRILTYSIEENCPLEETVMRTKFLHTMFTGMRNPNIRAELRELCKGNPKIPDQTLLKFAAEASKNETERNEKLSSAKNSATISEICKENDLKSKGKEKKEKLNPFTQIEEVKSSHAKEIASLRAELLEIKNDILSTAVTSPKEDDVRFYRENTDRGQTQNFNRNFRGRGMYRYNNNVSRDKNRGWKNLCEQCVNSNAERCLHCFKCGLEGHRSFKCNTQSNPSNEKNE